MRKEMICWRRWKLTVYWLLVCHARLRCLRPFGWHVCYLSPEWRGRVGRSSRLQVWRLDELTQAVICVILPLCTASISLRFVSEPLWLSRSKIVTTNQTQHDPHCLARPFILKALICFLSFGCWHLSFIVIFLWTYCSGLGCILQKHRKTK